MKTYILAFALSAAASFLLGLAVIPLLKRLRAGQSILSYVKEHESKNGTPTMGGLFFVPTAAAVALLFSSAEGFRTVLVVCSVGMAFMAVGFLDDFIKIRLKRNEGLKPYQKILFQLAVALVASLYAYYSGQTSLVIPFWGRSVSAGLWVLPLAMFVFVATSNCVNLTDGLDGLAGGVSFIYFLMTALIIVIEEGCGFFEADDMAVVCVCLAGSLIGFLCFNTNKASVFMGDTGSLALGGLVAAVGLFSKNMLFIPIVGAVFVMSGVSVIIQVLVYKKTRRRVFLMAPVHHHFQMKGFSESKIAFAYKTVTLLLGLVSAAFLIY